MLGLLFQHRVLDALAGLGRRAMRLALHALHLGLGVATGLLRGLADVARDLVQPTGLMRLRRLDARRLLEDSLGLVAGVGELVVRLAAGALHLGLGVPAGLLRCLADIMRDLVQTAWLFLFSLLRADGGCAVERESGGERRDAYVDLHSILQRSTTPYQCKSWAQSNDGRQFGSWRGRP